ncbi:Phosphate/sulfate permease [Paenibacillus larvae subsp. larvae]|uniref:Phosphate/sulfate permease n=1 Tax=Paenibacillus larvae subsp. larvae TaxID=147375 RepID=A0A2L1UF15_9BACL|nr:inorganic phosphate transporter [Paenibacillus larvae]AQZ48693.1 anion permease [Paenibacillus larvae subsp. pulvifaciens]AVF26778.1 Phosphate/sulfate permease [Paenibacillus larvae subsp. larvae]AVF31525.1 Phosphate/sulfate permease [Paenibacillus larvae subsp. larvae]MBH0343506.1 inorganic phosphate transporter [Paenibacillus larvae]MCY7522051.1 inorganic phosphate transporter [Paenibacillus larvae]
MIITISIIVVLAVISDFINGFHDTANAIATSISTKALSPRVAIIYAAILNFIGALIFEGVAKNIGGSIANPFQVEHGMQIVIAALISTILWNLFTWYFGIPSSSTHTLIGSLAGAVAAGSGFASINWTGFKSVIIVLISSPVIGFIAGVLFINMMKGIVYLLGNRSQGRYNRVFRFLQIFTAGGQAFSHGMNDAQKAMGIIVFALVAGGFQETMHVPLWVKLIAATAIALGTAIGGGRIIKTVGSKIVKIQPINGFTSDLCATTILQVFTFFNMPLSTTHVITSSIVGTGFGMRPKGVSWGMVKQMVLAWIITIPISFVIAFLLFKVLFFTL